MSDFVEKHRKSIFFIVAGIAFIMIYAYNILTPYLSDDYFYLHEVRQAESIWDLIKQQYGEYLSNSGRVVGQFNIRLSLAGSKQIFNIINSTMFLALVLLIYANIKRKRKYDILVLLAVIVFLWKYAVSFGQTMLWICGACNYLWGSVFILGFFTFYRYWLEHTEKLKHPALLAAGTFFFGLLAGWCNENTSGGGLLLILMFTVNVWWQRKKEGKKTWYAFMVSGMAGMCCGILGMVTAPGVRNRSATMSEGEYTGIVGYLSRIYKTTVTLRELFFPLFIIITIVLVLLVMQKKLKGWRDIRTNESILFLIAGGATAYALILAPVPADRAYFGAGIFLIIACIQGIQDTADKEFTLKAVKYSLVSVLCLWLFFTYFENLVNLARICREENERIELIQADYEVGSGIVVIPQFREEFKNPYSNAHDSDLTEDKDYWINLFYEIYYDIGNITAIPRDEWNRLYGEAGD